jgi:hypothetical protein
MFRALRPGHITLPASLLESLLIFSYRTVVPGPAAGGIDFLWRARRADSVHFPHSSVFSHHPRNSPRLDGLEDGGYEISHDMGRLTLNSMLE